MSRDPRFDILFQPVKIGPKTARNRFFQVPHASGMTNAAPHVRAAFREMKAEGGWAVVSTGACSVDPSSDDSPFPCATLWDQADLRSHALMTEAAHRQGALAAIELWHGGAAAMNRTTRHATLSPSGVPWMATHVPFMSSARPRVMDAADIRDLIRWHAEAAVRAEQAGFEYALSQIRFTAGYGAENQHESVAFSHALLAATTKLKVIAAILPGPWQPALAAKQLATIDQLTNGRIAVNIVSGWFKGEFQAIGEHWLEHDERYRRSEEFIRALKGIWTQDDFTFKGDFYRFNNYTLKPKPLGQPEVFQGGSSRAARDMAARVSDWYFTNGNTPEGIKAQVDDIRTKAAANNHSVKVGVNAFIIARDTAEEGGVGMILDRLGRLGIWLPLIAVDVQPRPGRIVEAIKAGSLDYLALPLDPERFTRCLLRIEKEAEQFGAARRRMIEARDRISTLSAREREVLDWLAEGSSNKAIARELDISPRTVEIHRANMMTKLGARHAAEAVRLKLEAKLEPRLRA